MELVTIVLVIPALLAVILMHWNLWRLLDEQNRHNRAAESLLVEVWDRLAASVIGGDQREPPARA